MTPVLPQEKQDSHRMQAMFRTIAPRYDFITRAFSYGMDRGWKREAVDRTALPDGARVLDLACGTGDFSTLLAEAVPRARPVAVDLTEDMVRRARGRGIDRAVCADALQLPFAGQSFDAVFIGYGIRNFPALEGSLGEIRRVLRPGGWLVTLDFFLPRTAALRRIYLAYLYLQGAFWGLVLHGRPRTYTYIPDSLRSFVSAPEFCRILRASGYRDVLSRTFLSGGIALHWAVRDY